MRLRPSARAELEQALAAMPHRLVWSQQMSNNVHTDARSDAALAEADVAFGQPDPRQVMAEQRLRWLAVTAAGYTRYDFEAFKETLRARGAAMTNASSVFADPCAQHVLAMMLALNRGLLEAHATQIGERAWSYVEQRYACRLLTGQTVVLLGYGAIGRRLAELLEPFGMTLYAVRRQTRSEVGVRIVPEEKLSSVLPLADHVVNVLPDNESTRHYLNARRLACLRPGARLYNVGRGATVDQAALIAAAREGRLGAAYLDVMEPEPLPPEHALWDTPNIHITPHIAGGMGDQDEKLVRHFLANLAAWEKGGALTDRVV
ncbi:D-2-hydroxyacid dehydrogenase [Horticoccus luteus]|uniref:D-2-hydroxyacid dehydrogenase n=2 Tax=Horticoccus luteus TaxID=2862869 RepID=A0A8F9TWY5_9BACT|nr:D-2-hydroxyacid dehydrogenase [Horticoccus luteus]